MKKLPHLRHILCTGSEYLNGWFSTSLALHKKERTKLALLLLFFSKLKRF